MPSQPVGLQESILFGEDFELDLRPRRLRHGSRVLKLERIPLEILLLLLEHPGKIVTREEIVARVWGGNVFLDTDNSIRGAIRKIRQVLKDDPEQPRFIQTVTTRGYRFIARVITAADERQAEAANGGNRAETANLGEEKQPGLETTVLHLPDQDPSAGIPFQAQAHSEPGILLAYRWPLVGLAAVLVVGVAFVLFKSRHTDATPPKITSLAVLPLENISDDPKQEYLVVGITDELTTDLAKISALKVISWTSAMQFKGTKEPLPQIAKQLNVDAVVEGSVERSGSRVRITARLIDARNDRSLWAESYEQELGDVLALESRVANAIASEIRVELNPEEQARLATARTVDANAEEDYLKGRYELDKWTREGLKNSFKYFSQAVKEDPAFAEAWAGLSDAYFEWGQFGIAPLAETLPKARAAAQRALELDETLSEAHVSAATSMAGVEGFQPAVVKELQRAIALDPSNVRAHQAYGRYLLTSGRLDQAIAELERAEELDPLTPKKKNNLGVALYFAGRYDAALEWFHQVPDPDLDSERRHYRMAEIYEHKRMQKEAIAEFVASLRFGAKADLAARVERSYLSSGYAEAKETLLRGEVNWAEKQAKSGTVPENAFWIARDYAILGDKNKAIGWLDIAYQNHSQGYEDYKTDPQLADLRSDPRVQELDRRFDPRP